MGISGSEVPRKARLRLALVLDRFGNRYGGAEAYGVELARELADRYDVTIFARDYDPECGLQLPWVRLSAPSWFPGWLRVLWFAVRARYRTKGRFDIVHSHMNGWCGDVEVIHVTPVRYNWRVRSLPPMKRLMSRVSLRVQTYLGLEELRVRKRNAHRVVAVSGVIAGQMGQAYPHQRNCPVIMPGVALPPIPDASVRNAVRERLGMQPEQTLCLMVALDPMRKGLPAVLNAMERLPEPVRLVVVGCSDAMRRQIRALPAFAGLAGRILLQAPTSDVSGYYAAADICLHPTKNDSFGMVPLEAMSYGVPVVLSPAPWCGFAEYVAHGRNALLMPHPEDSEALAGCVERLMRDSGLRERLAKEGRALAASHGWPQVAQAYEALYGQILAERGGAS